MTGQQVRCLKALAEQGLRVDANRWIMASESNGLEYLLKGRFYKLAKSVVTSYSGCEKSLFGEKCRNAENIRDYLGLDGQRCHRLRQTVRRRRCGLSRFIRARSRSRCSGTRRGV